MNETFSHGWSRTHWFMHGWGWRKGSLCVYDFQLRTRGITNWVSVSEEMKNDIAQEVKKEHEEFLKVMRSSPRPPIDFNQPIPWPVINQKPPELNLNELIQVQPTTERTNGTN